MSCKLVTDVNNEAAHEAGDWLAGMTSVRSILKARHWGPLWARSLTLSSPLGCWQSWQRTETSTSAHRRSAALMLARIAKRNHLFSLDSCTTACIDLKHSMLLSHVCNMVTWMLLCNVLFAKYTGPWSLWWHIVDKCLPCVVHKCCKSHLSLAVKVLLCWHVVLYATVPGCKRILQKSSSTRPWYQRDKQDTPALCWATTAVETISEYQLGQYACCFGSKLTEAATEGLGACNTATVCQNHKFILSGPRPMIFLHCLELCSCCIKCVACWTCWVCVLCWEIACITYTYMVCQPLWTCWAWIQIDVCHGAYIYICVTDYWP